MVTVQDNCYTSQLIVNLSYALLSKHIRCGLDDSISVRLIGSFTLSGTTRAIAS